MIGVTGSFIFFGVLDLLMVPVLSFAVLFFARHWDYRKLNIAFSDSRPSRESEAVFKETPPSPADISTADYLECLYSKVGGEMTSILND